MVQVLVCADWWVGAGGIKDKPSHTYYHQSYLTVCVVCLQPLNLVKKVVFVISFVRLN